MLLKSAPSTIGLLFSILVLTFGCKKEKKAIALSGVEAYKAHIGALAHDSMEGRETGTAGEAKAALYIQNEFIALGIEPWDEDYFQEFEKRELANPHESADHPDNAGGKLIQGKNVIGVLNPGGGDRIIIGAHYDHLGYGDEGSLHRGEKAIHNGADDNASGVAVMLELAEKLKASSHSNEFVFIAFSGEEKGLWGSNFFCKQKDSLWMENTSFMLNMDMVGRLSEEKLAVNGTGTAAEWDAGIEKVNASHNFVISSDPSGIGPSDHTSFYLKNVPVIQLFTGAHEDYHKPEDDIEKINWEGLEKIESFVLGLINELGPKGQLTFQKTKDKAQSGPRFTVTLGVVPDYLFDGKGMRIDGVSDGKVADGVGIKAGDVVVKLGELEVSDMHSYMEALSKFSHGEATSVVVDRNGQLKNFDVVFPSKE